MRSAMPAHTRTLAVAASALALGAGAGATAIAVTDSHSSTTTTVTQAAPATALAAVKTTSALTVNQIYQRTKDSVVDLKTGAGEGTGFVLSSNGDIVTNEHVVGNAKTVKVTFANGRTATANVVGTDPSSDVAVVRVSGVSGLKPLTFADSSKAAVGDPVVAIGSPYGLAETVTTGIVSALNRTITSPDNYSITGAVQTDAAINPGNSGGPLINAEGDVVGMNSQIESRSNGNTGVGFAIASNTVRNVAQQLAAGHQAQHAYLGVELGDGTNGAQIGTVRDGSPASKAGLQQGDTVVAIDGKPVSDADAAVAAINAKKPGDKIALTVARGGQRQTVTATLGTRPAS